MGTIFALRALLVLQGNTLQQIEPHLAGVFRGDSGRHHWVAAFFGWWGDA